MFGKIKIGLPCHNISVQRIAFVNFLLIYRVTVAYFVPYLCQLVSAAILKCSLLRCHLNTLCRQVNDHVDIFLNELTKFNLNNMVNLQQ